MLRVLAPASAPAFRVGALSGLLCVLCLLAGCGRPALPDPRVAARSYAEAAARGDAATLHALLTREARRTYGLKMVSDLVRDERAELTRQAAALSGPDVRIEATATLPLSDGGVAVLTLEADEFRVASGDTLPGAARTPAEALDGLRRALARRSYSALLRVLSAETRGALETDLRSLGTALENSSTLDVRIEGDRAEVDVGGGHHVSLRREGGTWRVEDVE